MGQLEQTGECENFYAQMRHSCTGDNIDDQQRKRLFVSSSAAYQLKKQHPYLHSAG